MNPESDDTANDIFPFPRRVIPSLLVALGLFGFTMLAIVVAFGRKPSYDVLFADLSPDAAASITAKLKADDVPYDLAATTSGTTIRIPPDRITEERLRLAGSGLDTPKTRDPAPNPPSR